MGLRAFVFAIVMLVLNSCVRSPQAPMKMVQYPPATGRRCLIVFLPGRGDRAETFDEKGFVAAVREAGIAVDMVGADAHLGYYLRKNFPERLHNDVVIPARKKGYKHIWLVGVSMGGLGALWYDGKYPGEITGLVALAPYLGEAEIGREVYLSGGLSGWSPSSIAESDLQRQIWRGLKVFDSREKTFKRIYLGYGLRDSFAFSDSVFADILPPGQVFTYDGGHDWNTWRSLWKTILGNIQLDRCCR